MTETNPLKTNEIMGYVIEITEDKAMDMKEHARKILKHGKELFECIEEIAEGSHMGERGGYGHYGNRSMGYREEDGRDYGRMGERDYGRGGSYGMRESERDDYRMGERYQRGHWEEEPPYMNERRGRSPYTGRYVSR